VHLSPKAFDLLAVLVARRPAVLSKTQLQQHLWPDTFVVEANLANLVAEIRQALGDESRRPLFIRTVHGRGYAFCATESAPGASESFAGTDCWLEWGSKRFTLTPGINTIGRDLDVAVRLDAATVSRRHARVIVAPGRVLLEDAGSKNGTFKGETRLMGTVELRDGDAVRIGSLRLVYHARGSAASTETQAPSTT
jgi:hypothetical protein